jgi:mRNA-degrading endonuclease toxin of MazEF toxin-antitoxin module
VSQPIQLPPPSSSAFAPVIVLRPEPSRLLSLWWLALHALLAATALLVGWPWPAKVAALAAVLGHSVWRRPRPARAVIEVDADGSCRIPGTSAAPFAPGTRTRLMPFWLRIVARNGADTVDILLLVDQINPADWRRLTAILRRATAR